MNHPGKTHFQKESDYTKKLLIDEEYKAEKRITVIRVLISIFLTVIAVIEANIAKINIWSYILPFLIAFVLSAGFFIEIALFNSHRSLKFKKKAAGFQPYFKYMVIVMDIIGFSYVIYHTHLKLEGSAEVLFLLENTEMLSITMLLITLLFVDIFRFSVFTSIFIGVLGSLTLIYFGSIQKGSGVIEPAAFFSNTANIFYLGLIISSSILSSLVSKFFRTLVIKSKRQDELQRFLPESIAQQVLNGEKEIEIGGKRSHVTALFSDIKNFTSLSENADPEAVVNFLNTYFNDMINIVFKYGGSLDKILGDSIMALFGTTGTSGNEEEMAVRTAIDMNKQLKDFNVIRKMTNLPEIKIGIGIHSGEVILGNIGCKKRMEFTAIGDTVNIASRLQDLTKKTEENIIVSEHVFKNLPESIPGKVLGNAVLKGKEKKVRIYGIK